MPSTSSSLYLRALLMGAGASSPTLQPLPIGHRCFLRGQQGAFGRQMASQGDGVTSRACASQASGCINTLSLLWWRLQRACARTALVRAVGLVYLEPATAAVRVGRAQVRQAQPLATCLVLDDGCAPACHLPPPGMHASGQDAERQQRDQQQQGGSNLSRMCECEHVCGAENQRLD